MLTRFSPVALAVALALGAGTAEADLNDIFSVRGYGTTGVVHSDENRADFVSSVILQPKGAGFSDEWSTAVDSKLGLQINLAITDRLSGVVQLVSEGSANNSWDGDPNKNFVPSLEWANLSYQVTDEFKVRGGRIVVPALMISDSRKVGFAQHWIRPPVDVYGLLPFTSSDGLELSYSANMGDAVNTLVAYYGYQSLRSTVAKAQVNLWGLNETFEKGALMVRGAYINISAQLRDSDFGPLYEGYANLVGMFGPQGQAAAAQTRGFLAQLKPSGPQKIEHYDLGVTYDPGQWFVMGEVFLMRSSQILGSADSAYVSAGYRARNFTPFATLSRVDVKDRNFPSVPVAIPGAPPQLAGPIFGLGSAINGLSQGFLNVDTSQQTMGVGVRWDFASKYALKAQYDYVEVDAGSHGQFINIQPGVQLGGVSVFSVAVDFLF